MSQVWNVCHNPSYLQRIIYLVWVGGKPYRLVTQYIAILKQVGTGCYLKLGLSLFSNNKERLGLFDMKESGQIPIPTVKYISCQWLVVNFTKEINVMHIGVGYIIKRWYLGHNIYLSMYFDSGFRTSKLCPIEDAHAKVDCGRIDGIKLSVETKLSIYPLLLGLCHHIQGEMLKNLRAAQRVSLRYGTSIRCNPAETKMKRLFGMCANNVREFTEAFTSKKLTKHKNEELAPISEAPLVCLIWMCCNQTLKFPLGKKVSYLTEYISTGVHDNRNLNNYCKGSHFKSATGINERN